MIYGYGRVSTGDQSLDAQIEELKAAGCQQVFTEKVSGARVDRRQLTKLMTKLGKHDSLVVCRLDRLARSSRNLLNILHEVGMKEAIFRSIHDPWADTATAQGRLMLTVLGGLAEFERALICSRTGEGRERAMRAGVKFGRKPKLTRHQRLEAVQRRGNGESLMAIARTFNVSHSTISRIRSAT